MNQVERPLERRFLRFARVDEPNAPLNATLLGREKVRKFDASNARSTRQRADRSKRIRDVDPIGVNMQVDVAPVRRRQPHSQRADEIDRRPEFFPNRDDAATLQQTPRRLRRFFAPLEERRRFILRVRRNSRVFHYPLHPFNRFLRPTLPTLSSSEEHFQTKILKFKNSAFFGKVCLLFFVKTLIISDAYITSRADGRFF